MRQIIEILSRFERWYTSIVDSYITRKYGSDYRVPSAHLKGTELERILVQMGIDMRKRLVELKYVKYIEKRCPLKANGEKSCKTESYFQQIGFMPRPGHKASNASYSKWLNDIKTWGQDVPTKIG